MLKVIVITRCEYCDGEAYFYVGEYKDEDGEEPPGSTSTFHQLRNACNALKQA